MEFLIYFSICISYFICLNFLTMKKNKALNKVKKPILTNTFNVKNKETLRLINKYDLKNLEIVFLDNVITKLKNFQNLVFQNESWKIVPNKLMFFVPKPFLEVNNKLYSIILSHYKNISFTSDVNFAKTKYMLEKNIDYYFSICLLIT